MINQELQQQLKNAASADHFTEICQQHALKFRGANGIGFSIFAYHEDDWDNRIISSRFCPTCGTADLPQATLQCKTEYCKSCGIKFGEIDDDEPEYGSDIFNDACLNSNRDVPDHVTRGEVHDDRMNTFLNEY